MKSVVHQLFVFVHVELLFDFGERKFLRHHGADLIAPKQQIIDKRVQVGYVPERAMRRDLTPGARAPPHAVVGEAEDGSVTSA